MQRRHFLSLLAGSAFAQPSFAPPNIVLILADDLGATDLGCYGSDLHETPRIDRISRQSLRFSNALSPAPVCSPTRAALLTGKHPARLGITIWSEGALTPPTNQPLLPATSEPNLAHAEVTLAEVLQQAGYSTALVGKWHLGDAGHHPETQGFEVNIGGTHWGAPPTYFYPYSGPFGNQKELRYVPSLTPGAEGEYLTDRLTTEALRVIDAFHARQKPFFLYLAHHAPHTPIEAKPALVAKYEAKIPKGVNHTNAKYAAMVESLDQSVGRVLDHLRIRGLDRNTIFIITSDNGGFLQSGNGPRITTNAPLRSGKGSLYEGGIRVPLIINWPGVTPVGAVSAEPVVLTDLFPTLCAAAKAPVPAGATDGLDLLPVLRNPAARLPREAIHFHYPHYYPTTTPVSAIRTRDWKLLEYFEDDHVELYNLAQDPSEKTNLAEKNPAKAKALRDQLHAWRESVGARLPTPNTKKE